MESGRNGNTVLMTVIGVATLLVALVGATFAYFSATVNNEQAQSVTITTATPVSLQYAATQAIALPNALPGANKTVEFTVKNPADSSVAQTYDLHLVVDANEFVNTKDQTKDVEDGTRTHQLLVTITAQASAGTEIDESMVGTSTYEIKHGETIDQTATFSYNFTDGSTARVQIVDDQLIAKGETITYTIKLEFLDLKISQNANQGKTFSAHIEISDPRSV